MAERKLRMRLHKGKMRNKFRLPRKRKKALNKKWHMEWKEYQDRLMTIYGEDWLDYIAIGG